MTQKGEMVERLQVKASSIGRILSNLEKKYHSSYDGDMKKSPSGQHLKKLEIVRIQRIPPFNANKIRKSPSAEPPEAAAAASCSADAQDDEFMEFTEEIEKGSAEIEEVAAEIEESSNP